MNLITVIDCTSANLPAVKPPPGVLMACYVTGTPDIRWSDNQIAAHPGAVRIDQAPVNTTADETADVLDVERGAATIDDIPGWVEAARTSFGHAIRPGQRRPAVYLEHSELTPAANVMNAAGLTSGVGIWLTEPMTLPEAEQLVINASGPFPIIAVQYEFGPEFDISIVSAAWLNDVSKAPQTSHPGPGKQTGWKFCRKCQSLFYGPQEAISFCPRGAQHDGTESHTYTLEFDR